MFQINLKDSKLELLLFGRYGVVSPDSVSNCWFIRIICAIESFNGILFASCCGAILYSKINRIQFRAPVTFSRAICLQYGKGLVQQNAVRNSMIKTSLLPKPNYPFIEFRIVHDVSLKLKL